MVSLQILVEASHINIGSQLYLYSPPATANGATETPKGIHVAMTYLDINYRRIVGRGGGGIQH